MSTGISRRRELGRGELSRLVIWTGMAGPVRLGAGSVALEYRGRLGHPSSYGLLAARSSLTGGDPTGSIELEPGRVAAINPPVRGDEIIGGFGEPSFAAAVRQAGRAAGSGMVVTAAASGRLGSSSGIFYRLAMVLAAILDLDWIGLDEQVIWHLWDTAPTAEPGQ